MGLRGSSSGGAPTVHGTHRRLYGILSKGQRLLPMKRVWKRGEVGREGLRPCGSETSQKSADRRRGQATAVDRAYRASLKEGEEQRLLRFITKAGHRTALGTGADWLKRGGRKIRGRRKGRLS